MPAGQRFPENHSDRPDVGRAGGVIAGEALRRDVGQRARHVAGRGERLGLFEQRQPEVEHADGHLIRVLEHDVRGLDVAMDDALAVRVRKRFENLRGSFHGVGIPEGTLSERLAKSLPGDVLVRDVHMAVVAVEGKSSQATRMA